MRKITLEEQKQLMLDMLVNYTEFCDAHGLKPTDSITVRAFLTGTVGNYGGSVIRKVAERYGIEV